MNDDQELCLCFHVSRRKVMQFIRVNRPRYASQLSECYGAGTGCGWCRPFLRRLMEESSPEQAELPSPEEYATQRAAYRKEKETND
ncbi:MAG: (2Fe-2S)-binding protein [Rubripirellula sp.]